MGKGSKPKVPKQPNLGQSYQQGIQVYLKYLPRLLAQEQNYRSQYDPQRIQEQQDLQDQYGAKQYQQMLDAFKALDPTYYSNREAQGASLLNDLNAGTSLTPDQQREEEQRVRGAQTARGNAYGGADADAEAYALGDRGRQLYQQRVSNMQNFLQGPTMPQAAAAVPPVSPDRSMAYVNPNAGYIGANFAQQQYQNALGASQLQSGSGSNPWGSILGTVAAVAPYAIAAFSDRRLKKNIKQVGTGPRGVKIYDFAYKNKFRGVMADEVEKADPAHVRTDPVSGYKMVSAKYAPVPVKG